MWTIIAILFVMWLFGFSFKVGGKLVHALLVIALIIAIYKLLF